ncbi:hypothetical protein [Mycoplasma phage sp.]|uniref:Uncharacterized protein n=1 Tax=Mycoplasmopsis anatis 1340 TaxID=1034808 RepID=F9QDI9_9BACT|nr:hypothetical protein [Mycoplasmopsis anatis]QRI43883.1 hypothetical protein [Mycoplasma phage sp.]AWX70371.1 hypothetical protein DP067_03375 [Mycoplasmopsis anatis]EGS29205.1 hypothetical protein GIG_02483 [Mycoplasmopsis anatis 1340]QRI43948.1 hypothetical protein [Mycoplasma phage sp.]QRI43983.1 hypothetical protein [Mycoplasma phage sp.]
MIQNEKEIKNKILDFSNKAKIFKSKNNKSLLTIFQIKISDNEIFEKLKELVIDWIELQKLLTTEENVYNWIYDLFESVNPNTNIATDKVIEEFYSSLNSSKDLTLYEKMILVIGLTTIYDDIVNELPDLLEEVEIKND